MGGCGFYGLYLSLIYYSCDNFFSRNPENKYYCSVCFKLEEIRSQRNSECSKSIGNSSSSPPDVDFQNEMKTTTIDSVKHPSPMRCFECKKKIGISGFKCRCEHTFCSTHRQFNKHNCTFDHKSRGREALKKANPAVIAQKIEKVEQLNISSPLNIFFEDMIAQKILF